MNQVYQQMWIELSKDKREKLAKIFNLFKSGVSEIRDEFIISDGYTNNDLKGITKEKLEAFTGKTGTFPELWEATIERISTSSLESKTAEEIINEPKPYCDFCVSTKGRHRKGCPKFK